MRRHSSAEIHTRLGMAIEALQHHFWPAATVPDQTERKTFVAKIRSKKVMMYYHPRTDSMTDSTPVALSVRPCSKEEGHHSRPFWLLANVLLRKEEEWIMALAIPWRSETTLKSTKLIWLKQTWHYTSSLGGKDATDGENYLGNNNDTAREPY